MSEYPLTHHLSRYIYISACLREKTVSKLHEDSCNFRPDALSSRTAQLSTRRAALYEVIVAQLSVLHGADRQRQRTGKISQSMCVRWWICPQKTCTSWRSRGQIVCAVLAAAGLRSTSEYFWKELPSLGVRAPLAYNRTQASARSPNRLAYISR